MPSPHMSNFITRLITAVFLAAGTTLLYLYLSPHELSVVLAFALCFILRYEWPLLNAWILTPIYPIGPFILLILLNNSNSSLFAFLCIIVFSHDIGSYCVGKLWGKYLLCPRISPGKTLEGFVGGCAASCVSAYLFSRYQAWNLPLYLLIASTLALDIVSFLGDIFESYLKRRAGIKDSGHILPGHGGLLDRLDGLLFAVCLLYPFRHYFFMYINK
jgi:CDP-diglyceride synthetase